MRFKALLFLSFVSFNAQAASGTNIDLYNGIVFPSNNWALLYSPGPLGMYADSMIDAAIATASFDNISLSGMGSYYKKAGAKVGFGLGGHGDGTIFSGVGYDFGVFQMGANVAVQTQPSVSGDINLGLRLGKAKTKGVHAAVNLYNLISFSGHWALGIGYHSKSWYLFEFDFDLQHESGGLGIQTATGEVGVSFIFWDDLSIKAGVASQILPDFSVGSDPFNFAISYWIFKRFNMYLGLWTRVGAYTVGFKFKT